VRLARGEAQEEIVSGSTPLAAALSGTPFRCGGRFQSGLSLMECHSLGRDGVIGAIEKFDQARFEGTAAFACEVSGMAGTAQQLVHFARPYLLP
jgi:hypothetical protein